MAKPKYIETPEKLWELFQDYKKEVKKHPRTKEVFGGKNFDVREEKLERPLTLVGFYNYCYTKASDVHNYFENTESRYDDYKGICSRIRDEIRQDQIEGGMVGQFNASITQRLNGLKEQMDHGIDANIKLLNIDPLADSD